MARPRIKSATRPSVLYTYEESVNDYVVWDGKIHLVDADDNEFESKVDQEGGSHLGVAILQDIYPVAANSSTTNLAASGTFTGTATQTLAVNAIQVSLKTDRSCYVYIDQSPDGINWDLSDTFSYDPVINSFGCTVQAINSYFRVRVVNRSTTQATTYFRLQSVLCPVADPLPRSLDPEGHLKTHIFGLDDDYGNHGMFSIAKDLRVAEPFTLSGVAFHTSNNSTFWTLSNSGTGSASTENIIATQTSGTAAGGYGHLQSVSNARFIFGISNYYRSLTRITALAVAGSVRRWGVATQSTITPQNGFYFEVSASGSLSVNLAKGGSVTSVSSGSFNGVISEYIMDTNYHSFEISYFASKVSFSIDDVLIHSFTPTDSVLTNTFNLPIFSTSVNSTGSTESAVIQCAAATVKRLGKEQGLGRYAHISTATTTVLKLGPGALHSIIVNDPTNNIITVYDNTSAAGTVIAVINPDASATPFQLNYDIPFTTGLTIVTAGTPDLTIKYE